MTICWREWIHFHETTLEGLDPTVGRDWNRAIDWTIVHFDYCQYGHAKDVGPLSWRWDTLIKPSEASFIRPSGMNEPCAFSVDMGFQLKSNTAGSTSFDLEDGILQLPASPFKWDPLTCSGRYYKNTTVWGTAWPHTRQLSGALPTITVADLPKNYTFWYPPGKANTYREELFRCGYIINPKNYAPAVWPWVGNPKEFICSVTPSRMHIQYLNAVTNTITPNRCGTQAGHVIVFDGMGFNNTNADIGGGWPWGGTCTDIVDEIKFIRKGDGLTYTYTPIVGALSSGEFRVDSNLRITLVTLAMQPGSYEVLLRKVNVKFSGQARTFDIEDYAGDWSVDPNGRVWRIGEDASGRITFLVTDDYMDPDGDPRGRLTGGKLGGGSGGSAAGRAEAGAGVMLLTDWQFENLMDEESLRHYSKLDTRGPDRFYEGRILAAPSITRATDDLTGLPAVSDTTIDLANHDLEMTKIMAQYLIVNRYVSLFAGFYDEPDAWREAVLRCIVDDHDDMGPTWRFYLKDISKKYSAVKIPKYLITQEEYPDASEDAIGRGMPEPLGLCYLNGEAKGAVKALCTDTGVNSGIFEYLAARGSLKSITEVYSDGEDMAGHWSVVYKDGGRTYIIFDADQGDNDVTFNCTGYMFLPWNDPINGYVQNPSYVLAFLISLIAEVPIELLDTESFDELATLFTNLGWQQTAHLIVQDPHQLEEKIEELCFTFGIKMWFDKYGRYKVGKKTLCDLDTDLILYDEIDALTPAKRKPAQRKAVNFARVLWDYYPCADTFKNANEETKQSSVDALKAVREDSRAPWEFKWTDSEDVVTNRIKELLLQRAYGYPRIYFSLPMVWFRELDVFDNFYYQSHFGPSTTGSGEKQRLYYIESIGYDFDGEKMDIIGVDLTYLMAQCMIIGKCAEINADYTLASPWMRAFAYIGRCTEGTFANGDPNKLICKCECDF